MSKLMMLVAAKWREFTARGQEDEEEEEEEVAEEEEPEPEPVSQVSGMDKFTRHHPRGISG